MQTYKFAITSFVIPLLICSCKDEKAQQTIKDLEQDIAVLNETNLTLNEQLRTSGPRPGSLTPEEADRLQQRINSLDKEIQRLSPFESKCRLLENDLVNAKAQFEKATTIPIAPSLAASAKGDMLNAIQDKNGVVLSAVSKSVLIIEGDISQGTGFMAKTGGKIYLYTAGQVISGNSKLVVKSTDGTKYTKFGAFEYAEGADLVRMEVLDEVQNFLEIIEENTELPLQSEIAALGNGSSVGVVTLERGRVIGTSGVAYEVDASLMQGKSGGPVLHLESGKVVGLVTNLTSTYSDVWSDDTRQGEIRRTACRLNKAWQWKQMKIGSFLSESKSLMDYDKAIRLCYAVAALEPLTTGFALDMSVGNGSKTVKNVFDENKDSYVVKTIIQMNTSLTGKRNGISEQELKKQFRAILANTLSSVKRMDEAMKPETLSWIHRQHGIESQKSLKSAKELLNTRMTAFE